MRATTIIMAIASIGFIIIALGVLKSKKLRNVLEQSNVYSDSSKMLKFNGIFNLSIGIIGLILSVLDYFFYEKSKIIVIIFIVVTILGSLIQSIMGKKYRNY
ncbi:hypothetical protein [Clostridium sp.]|uniref:hypothetical protein n=1 Tax=Clostridium sp. TaxID=1506 RepID=UPI003F2CE479